MKKQARVSYEIDPHNRLIVRNEKEGKICKYREVIDGEFGTDKFNNLAYHIKKSADFGLPQQIRLSGRWSLGRDHNLEYTLDKWNNQCAGNKLVIKGGIIDTQSNQIIFSVITRDSENNTRIYILRLEGVWQADAYNRLAFCVERERGLCDTLTLQGAWEVNAQNYITYTYKKTRLKTKKKVAHTLTFAGHWQINDRGRILYVLNKEIGSSLDLKINFIKALKNALQYEIGIGAVPKKKILLLSGKWQLHPRLGVLFEIEYANRHRQRIIFGATAKLDSRRNLELKLKNSEQKDLGMELILSQRFLKGKGEVFIRALGSKKEQAILAGMGLRW